jgi:hypothetical protein
MKIISTRVHAMLDYLVSIVLLLYPFITGINNMSHVAAYIMMACGIVTFLVSLFTNYEFSLFKKIPMKVHLTIDTIQAFFLIASPWLLGFNVAVNVPHVLFGVLELLVVMLSQTQPVAVMNTTNNR